MDEAEFQAKQAADTEPLKYGAGGPGDF